MKQDHNIPLRRTSEGEQIETRPVYIEEWLDSLPYVDFTKTTELLLQATALTNQQTLKTRTRQELIELYHRPYQYYIDSQIRIGSHHTLKSIKTFQKQIEALKGIAINLGFACKQVIEAENTRKNSRWRSNKPPLLPMLMAMNYLSHALIFSFLKYSPTPKNVWQELNRIYSLAEDLGQENASILLPGADPKEDMTTIAKSYKRIIMSSLADHHHLPFGAIWEVFVQLNDWQELVEILPFSKPDKPIGYFAIDLDSDNKPTPLIKYDTKLKNDSTRLINASKLGELIQKYLTVLNRNERLDENLKLSPYYVKNILSYMTKSWGLPAKRYFNREPREGMLDMICGIEAVYFHFSGEQEFILPKNEHDEEDISISDTSDDYESTQELISSYNIERWNLVDESPGGFAVIKSDRPKHGIRVGDLLAITSGLTDHDPSENWDLGIIRWLMVRNDKVYRIGAQKILDVVKPCAVRALKGSSEDMRYRRGLLIGDINKEKPLSIITSRGLFSESRQLDLLMAGKNYTFQCDSLIESTTGFEQFSVQR